MSANRMKFTEAVYKVMDVLVEVKALLEEYDDGLPIVKNTSLIHKEIDSMKCFLRNLLVNYTSDDEDFYSGDTSISTQTSMSEED